jgi:acyl-CoA thioesterase FadM
MSRCRLPPILTLGGGGPARTYRRVLGLGADPFATTGFELIFAEFRINYRSPVAFDEKLDIGLRIADIRRSSFRVEFEMSVADRLCAEGYGVYVGFDYSEQRASPLPDPFRSRLEHEVAGEQSAA